VLEFTILLGLSAGALNFAALSGLTGVWLPGILVSLVFLLLSVKRALATSGDRFNPLVLLTVSAMLRFGIPALLLLVVEPPRHLAYLGLSSDDWKAGLSLSVCAATAVALGWWCCPSSGIRLGDRLARRSVHLNWLDQRAAVLSGVAFLLGLALTAIFYSANYSDPLGAVIEGIVRDADTRVAGTSRYYFLGALLLVYGGAFLAAYLFAKGRARGKVGFVPGVVAALVLIPTGGRVNALMPLAIAGLLYYYRNRSHLRRRNSRKLLLWGIAALMVVAFAAFIPAYRSGGGVGAGADVVSASGLKSYVEYSVWQEFGTLPIFSLASQFPGGTMSNAGYTAVLGIVGEATGITPVKSGQFLASAVVPGEASFGYHTGLFLDIYLNSSLLLAFLSCMILGVALRIAYRLIRTEQRTPVMVLLYAVTFWEFLWVFYESIGNLFSLTMGLSMLAAIKWASRILPSGRSTRGGRIEDRSGVSVSTGR
jgi:oligosaccharide repeat unit polymerase